METYKVAAYKIVHSLWTLSRAIYLLGWREVQRQRHGKVVSISEIHREQLSQTNKMFISIGYMIRVSGQRGGPTVMGVSIFEASFPWPPPHLVLPHAARVGLCHAHHIHHAHHSHREPGHPSLCWISRSVSKMISPFLPRLSTSSQRDLL